jgi:hypothetical protein
MEDCGPWRVPGGTYSNASIAWYKTVINERVVYLPWDDPFLLSGNNREPLLTLGWLVTGACNKSLWVDGPRREPHRSTTFRLSYNNRFDRRCPKSRQRRFDFWILSRDRPKLIKTKLFWIRGGHSIRLRL